MNRSAIFMGILALAASLSVAQDSTPVTTSTWVSDPNHCDVTFSISHMTISNVHGHFGKVDATLVYNESDITKSTVTATIGVDSIDTGVDQRNTHLKSPDFFDVGNLPTAAFASTSVTRNGSRLTVNGNLTLHGVTRPVSLDVDGPHGPISVGQNHKQHLGFVATTTISRLAFGIGPKFGSGMVGDDVKLSIDLDVAQQ